MNRAKVKGREIIFEHLNILTGEMMKTGRKIDLLALVYLDADKDAEDVETPKNKPQNIGSPIQDNIEGKFKYKINLFFT